jgi:outer membrane beta-barrel protein
MTFQKANSTLRFVVRRFVLGLSIGLVAVAARADEDGPRLPLSGAEEYRVNANYGASEAVLNPLYDRDGKLELSLGGAYSPTSSLMSYSAASAALTWHFGMQHSFEPIWYSRVWGEQGNFVKDEIAGKKDSSNRVRDSLGTSGIEIPENIYSMSYYYNPFYSKMSLSERTVAHFDVYLGLGPALVQNRVVYLNGNKGPLENRFGATVTAGLRFLMGSRWSLRAEIRDIIHPAQNFGSQSTGNIFQAGLSLGMFFGSFDRLED